MKTIPGLFFFLLRLAKDRRARCHRLMARLLRDEEGAWLISMTIMLPVLIGVAGLGTEGGMLFYQHRSLQSAADSAAYSAASLPTKSLISLSTTKMAPALLSMKYVHGKSVDKAGRAGV
jgi:Flp pilus assembly protein TadG